MVQVVKQNGGHDCGLLALAYAYDFSLKIDPYNLKYDHVLKAAVEQQSLMHLDLENVGKNVSMQINLEKKENFPSPVTFIICL
ncbi:hypothetical protein BpHYR1_028201 [Brachionus plicatilis]|uniref:Ubiquitin-like protease family profile domain-containing protein n=1 Tax=Brachionus plicatilis TaxID=10195 RepID=A0A3M7PI41_BRAPC|nr:hypothetical protein BpHYR1_028201 [Brachionus plicatilis]